MSSLESAALRLQQGDIQAFEDIVQQTSAQLVRVAARIVGDLTEAHDVVQESYISAYQALTQDNFDANAHVATWLRRIVINRSIDALRSRRRRPTLDVSTVEPGWDGIVGTEARMALLEIAHWMNSLVPEQRVALVLSVFEGLSNSEIAATMGCSEGAVEQRLVRARVALRQRSQ